MEIFASPTEPFFNSKGASVSSEVLEEMLQNLAKENEKKMKSIIPNQNCFKKQKKPVEFIFLMCEKLKQPSEAKYMAVDIFNRFMVNQVFSLYEYVMNSSSYTHKKQDWQNIINKLKKQMTLRMLSCLQVASKLCSHYKSLTAKKCHRILNEIGLTYSLDSILQSELCVLKTLQYELNTVSPFTYVEIILEVIAHNDDTIAVKPLHDISLKIMDLAYLRRQCIYEQLFVTVTGQACIYKQDRIKFAPVENDLMLFAVAIIAASSYVADQSTSDKVINHLEKITGISTEDILMFADILLRNYVDVLQECTTSKNQAK
ncbi:cyclin N-terminal domain-containing protein 1-like [Anneissia japonica]|uniref:cyclin N-terminal domain-containing protein 1-like n=1 Tax=Anneissia japonica TaxID=1529436 RepID=UPI0014259D72|nr:cyclin N-terminal domain-containing protein 1-like [Anneissia japonica]